MSKAIVGFDLGTGCGMAVAYQDGKVDSGVWSLAGGRHEGGGMRFLRFRRYLADVFDLTKGQVELVAVVYEEVRSHKGVDAAHIYGGLLAVLSEECETRGIPYKGIPVGTVKKLATGKGNAKKVQMIEAARALWPGFEPATDDEADARFVALAGVVELGGEDFRKMEKAPDPASAAEGYDPGGIG